MATLVASTAVAAAEPPGLTASTEPAAAPQGYVSIGGLGGVDGFLSAQVAAEGGYHLSDSLWLNMSAPDEPHDDLLAVVRAGFEIGGNHVRVRPGIESYSVVAGPTTGGTSGVAGINLTLGLAYQW